MSPTSACDSGEQAGGRSSGRGAQPARTRAVLLEAWANGGGRRVPSAGTHHQQEEAGGRPPGRGEDPKGASKALPVHLDCSGFESHLACDGCAAVLDIFYTKRENDPTVGHFTFLPTRHWLACVATGRLRSFF